MRTIYLVRHGETDLGYGKTRVCLGKKDARLSHEGEKQAQRLAQYFKGKELNGIFTSPLERCRVTAEILAEKSGHGNLKISEVEDFHEVDTGDWDGLTFDQIRDRYPREYEERGKALGRYVIPGGESLLQAGERFGKRFYQLLEETEGDILVAAHAGVIRAFLCELTGTDIDRFTEFPVPYASVTLLCQDAAGNNPEVKVHSFRPVESISLSEVDRMWAECGVTPEQRAHMEMVAGTAMNVIEYDLSLVAADWLETSYRFRGTTLNTRLLYYAALLHDLRRADGKIHPVTAAEYLVKQGYLELADVIRLHHDPAVYQPGQPVNEAEVLYYADKLVQGDRLVTIEERFEKSRKKCNTPEALENHKKRYEAAVGIQKKLG